MTRRTTVATKNKPIICKYREGNIHTCDARLVTPKRNKNIQLLNTGVGLASISPNKIPYIPHYRNYPDIYYEPEYSLSAAATSDISRAVKVSPQFRDGNINSRNGNGHHRRRQQQHRTIKETRKKTRFYTDIIRNVLAQRAHNKADLMVGLSSARIGMRRNDWMIYRRWEIGGR
ncbi:hypothetical protein GWI33_011725 [Rhynchophorus ferrugineus]|uniref:Uncharacterized protein n=1 Tax=Rhynchophorus ferrugineus TaxID=354439 RepID=A0A834IWH3_RHYFE|nr:hypothetical protein GWI33_011725 [Rhynchophorus ferrugineus]